METPVVRNDRPAVDAALLVVRLAAGMIFLAHGTQKLFGAFDGPGLSGVVDMMGPVGYLVTIGEFFGAIGVLLGFLSRFSAAAQIVIMIGAITMVHMEHGFFLPGGMEFNLALIGLLGAIMLAGPGRLSVGRLFLPRSKRTGRPLIVLE